MFKASLLKSDIRWYFNQWLHNFLHLLEARLTCDASLFKFLWSGIVEIELAIVLSSFPTGINTFSHLVRPGLMRRSWVLLVPSFTSHFFWGGTGLGRREKKSNELSRPTRPTALNRTVYWILMSLTGFYRVLFGFHGMLRLRCLLIIGSSNWTGSDFIEVLIGFTGFCTFHYHLGLT